MNHSALKPICLLGALTLGIFSSATSANEPGFRPPAVPLVACDPYFSVWSQSDHLTDTATTHWTGKQQRLGALVRIDGHACRLMGAGPESIDALKQTSVAVLPTRTIYKFAGHGVSVTLTFTTPALPDDLLLLSRPTTYINCEVSSADGKPHDVDFYFDASGELATDRLNQQVAGATELVNNAVAIRLGSTSQRVLNRSGDDIRIDWGYLYVAADKRMAPNTAFGKADDLRAAFDRDGAAALKGQAPTFPVNADQVVAAVAMSLGKVEQTPVSRYALIAYDDLYAIEFMNHKLRPYWRKDGWNASDLIEAAVNEHDALERRCADFDAELLNDVRQAGGDAYADIAALAYRQCFAAGKFVADDNGQPLQFSKENHSNGCMATSDVFYPMAPQFLLFGPTLTKSFITPFMKYAASDRWRFPFAPHDLGQYPKANGQRYGGQEDSEENQMPVEECGNLLLLFAALARMEGNADFAGDYWDQLSLWAAYLADKGFDPENQLCTDDFAGHMAHNVNLSAKAICGLGAYAMMAEMRGMTDEAARYRKLAGLFARNWVEAARDDDHYRLAFDRRGTWSQKYNLVWDRILDLKLFPAEVYETEMAYYRRIQNPYGLPLDNRSDYTKLDWILWTATLTEKRDDFEALVRPVHRFLNETPDRSPMTDWYFTSTAKKRGFTARPVVGGVFLRMLYEKAIWKKYASRDKTRAANWAPMPKPTETKTVVATGADSEAPCRYTTERPADDWFGLRFDDAAWKEGVGGLGTKETPGARIGEEWNTSDIWLRRFVTLPNPPPSRLALRIHHDEDAAVYINGKRAFELGGYTTGYEVVELSSGLMREGENLIAIHCHQTTGGQFIDFGVDEIVPAQPKRR